MFLPSIKISSFILQGQKTPGKLQLARTALPTLTFFMCTVSSEYLYSFFIDSKKSTFPVFNDTLAIKIFLSMSLIF